MNHFDCSDDCIHAVQVMKDYTDIGVTVFFACCRGSLTSFIHLFISGMHHYESIAPNIDINLQSGRF